MKTSVKLLSAALCIAMMFGMTPITSLNASAETRKI